MHHPHAFALSATATLVFSSGFILAPASASQLVQGPSHYLDFDQDAHGNSLLAGNGELIDDEWSSWGLQITGDSYRAQANDYLLLYDSAKAGKDNDLRTGQFSSNARAYQSPAEGNLLIIHEDIPENTLTRPDDETLGGAITFDFTGPLTSGNGFYNPVYRGVELGTIRLIDVDDNPTLSGVSFHAFAGDRALFSMTAQELNDAGLASSVFAGIDAAGNNSIWDFNLGSFQRSGPASQVIDTAITKLVVQYDGSGAIAGLGWHELYSEDDNSQSVPEPASILGLLSMGLLAKTALKRR